MLTFSPKGYAKELKEENPDVKRMTVEVCDSDGALCIYVRDPGGDPIGYFDTGLDGNDDDTEAQQLADELVTALKSGRKSLRVEAKRYDYEKDPEEQWDDED